MAHAAHAELDVQPHALFPLSPDIVRWLRGGDDTLVRKHVRDAPAPEQNSGD